MAVAAYLRVSTEEQRERQSIATQREFVARYCELHQLPIHEIYEDDGGFPHCPFGATPRGPTPPASC